MNNSLSDAACIELTQKALAAYKQGDDRGYRGLIQALGKPEKHKERLEIPVKWLRALKHCSAVLNPNDFQDIFAALYAFDLYQDDEVVIAAYISLLLDIVSANSTNTASVCKMLIQYFYPRKSTTPGDQNTYDVEGYRRCLPRVHRTLAQILRLVPSSSSLLYSLIAEKLPHKTSEAERIKLYLQQMLEVVQYCPALRSALISLAISQVLQIDVEINLEAVAEDDDDENEIQFELELQNNSDYHESKAESMASKLDIMMELLFGYLQTMDVEKATAAKQELFGVLLQTFDELIIKSDRSKYTQFLIFFFCSFDPIYRKEFLAYLLKKIAEPSTHSLTRRTCAAYLGSYLARANYLSRPLIEEALTQMVSFCHMYLRTHEGNEPDAELHGLFYALAQSIFYLYCFKHTILLEDENGRHLFREFNIDRIAKSSLTPFKFCPPTVIAEFIRITQAQGLLPCGPSVVAANTKLILPTRTVSGRANQVELFFPFDPYLLRHSSRFISPIYRTWQAPTQEPTCRDEDSDEEEEESDSAKIDLRSSARRLRSYSNLEVPLATSMDQSTSPYSLSPTTASSAASSFLSESGHTPFGYYSGEPGTPSDDSMDFGGRSFGSYRVPEMRLSFLS